MTMTRKKAAWYNARAKSLGGYATASAVNKNKSADIYYRDSADLLMLRFLEALERDLKRHYKAVYTQNAAPEDKKENPVRSVSAVSLVLSLWKGKKLDLFAENAEQIVVRYVGKLSRLSKKNITTVLERFYGNKLSIPYTGKKYNDILRLIIKRNVSLLRNTAEQTISNVENIVYDAMTTGQGWKDIEDALRTQTDIAANRIKRIARDQTAKATEAINVISQRAAGAEFFEWSTSKDERVSTGYGGHKQLDGKIYRYDEPERYPVIDSYGHRGLPAQRVNCRCTTLSVWIMDGYHAEWSAADECYRIVRD